MHKARNSIAVIKQEIEVLLTVLQFLGRLNAKASLLWSMCWRRWVHRSLSRFGIYPSEGSAQVYVSAYPTFVFQVPCLCNTAFQLPSLWLLPHTLLRCTSSFLSFNVLEEHSCIHKAYVSSFPDLLCCSLKKSGRSMHHRLLNSKISRNKKRMLCRASSFFITDSFSATFICFNRHCVSFRSFYEESKEAERSPFGNPTNQVA